MQQPSTSDDFSSTTLGRQWQWQANPDERWLALTHPGLQLFCQPMPTREGEPSWYDVPNLLMQKFPAEEFEVTTHLMPVLEQVGDRCGLIIYGERFAFLGIEKSAEGLELVTGFGWMSDAQQLEQHQRRLAVLPEKQNITLRVTVQQNAICQFSWRGDNGEYDVLDDSFAAGPGKWVGAKVGLYALTTASGNSGSHAWVKEVKVTAIDQ